MVKAFERPKQSTPAAIATAHNMAEIELADRWPDNLAKIGAAAMPATVSSSSNLRRMIPCTDSLPMINARYYAKE